MLRHPHGQRPSGAIGRAAILLAATAAPSCIPTFLASNAAAQTADAGSSGGPQGTPIEEIVVTATRTPERLHDVPASISVLTRDQIQDSPAGGLDDILRQVPGMTLTMIGPDVGHPTAY